MTADFGHDVTASPAFDLVLNFQQSHKDGRSLEECLAEWVEVGDAVLLAGGDFSRYLVAVVLIIVSQAEGEPYENCAGERLWSLTDPEGRMLGKEWPKFLSREFWDEMVFRWQCGKQGVDMNSTLRRPRRSHHCCPISGSQ